MYNTVQAKGKRLMVNHNDEQSRGVRESSSLDHIVKLPSRRMTSVRQEKTTVSENRRKQGRAHSRKS